MKNFPPTDQTMRSHKCKHKSKSLPLNSHSMQWRLCAPVTLLCISHFFVFAAQAYVCTVLHLENNRMRCSHSWKSD